MIPLNILHEWSNDWLQTKCTEVDQPEKLRRGAEDFIDRSVNTDVCLIFAPSQVSYILGDGRTSQIERTGAPPVSEYYSTTKAKALIIDLLSPYK